MHFIEKIRAEHPAPFYIYDGKVISEQASILQETFPGFQFLFSVKANPFLPVLKKMAALGIGADAASAKEVALAIEAGMPAENIYYSCPAPTNEDLAQVIGKCHIIADSFHVLILLEKLAGDRSLHLPVGLRIHPDFTMDGSPQVPSKFGMEESHIRAVDFAKKYPHLSFEGLHIHIRSQVLDTEQLGKYYDNVMALAIRMQDFLGTELKYINFGGGIGMVYDTEKQSPLDYKKLNKIISSAKEKHLLSAKLILESGRFLACDCGTYVTEIVDIKESYGKKFYIVKNGANGFFKPVLRQFLLPFHPDHIGASYEPFATENDRYDIHVLSDSDETEVVDIVGHLCSGADIMAKDVTVKKGTIGDLVTFNHAGSYAYSLAPLLFASQPMPQQFFIDA